jgi:hypothetical protein
VLTDAAVAPDNALPTPWTTRRCPPLLNLDHYGVPPLRALPRDRHAAEARLAADRRARGHAVVRRRRRAPFRDELRRATRGRATAGHLAHYAADATMPLHATENHDGELSGQRGIHRRIEATLVDADLGEYTRRAWKVAARRPIDPDGAAGALFAALEQAYERLATVLAADRDARRGTKVGSRLYYRRLHADQRRHGAQLARPPPHGGALRGRMRGASSRWPPPSRSRTAQAHGAEIGLPLPGEQVSGLRPRDSLPFVAHSNSPLEEGSSHRLVSSLPTVGLPSRRSRPYSRRKRPLSRPSRAS